MRPCAIVLAAGGSSRLGKPKQLLRFRGETLLRRTISAARLANCSPILVVTGADREQVEAEVENVSGCSAVHNPEWRRGLGTSIRAGLVGLSRQEHNCEGVLLLVCDQPWIDGTALTRLLKKRIEEGKTIVATSYAQTQGVPAYFARSHFPELLALPDNEGAKVIIDNHPEEVALFTFPEAAVDIDTAADYEQLCRTDSVTR